MKLRRLVHAWMLLCAVAWPTNVSALANCSVSANPVSFGDYNPFAGSPLDAVGNVRVTCSIVGLVSLLVGYDILFSTGGSGTYQPRRLYSGMNTLSYNLYTDNARNNMWGDGTSGTSIVSDGYLLGLLTVTRDYPVYGRVPAGQNVMVGVYTDTIVVTVNY